MRFKRPRIKTLLLIPLLLFVAFYFVGALINLTDDRQVDVLTNASYENLRNVAIFGASGTAGDGILKAAMADPGVGQILVVTRRSTARIDEGMASGKVTAQTHMDYLDYSAVIELLADVQTVFWAIGTSTFNVDDKMYSVIHVDFPTQFVRQWLEVSRQDQVSLHYISSSDISEDAASHWAREKWRAESELSGFADGTKLKVIAWRPDYIAPTQEQIHPGQRLLYGFFAPLGVAVKAIRIGEAMLEVTARGDEFSNGDKLATASILRYSQAYRDRLSTVTN